MTVEKTVDSLEEWHWGSKGSSLKYVICKEETPKCHESSHGKIPPGIPKGGGGWVQESHPDRSTDEDRGQWKTQLTMVCVSGMVCKN